VTPHELRHTAVALWIAAGAGPKQVAARLDGLAAPGGDVVPLRPLAQRPPEGRMRAAGKQLEGHGED
jgi:hypothetical protein